MLTETLLKQTPLHAEHIRLGARMVPFGGWEMPLQYAGIFDEYQQTRRNVSVFDTSHMGEFIITGSARSSGLEELVTQSLDDLNVGACRYGMLLNQNGGVIDDLIVFRCEEERWLLVVNAGTRDKDAEHITARLKASNIFKDLSGQTAKLDVQGPASRDLLMSFIPGIEQLTYFTFKTFDVLGEAVLVSRTGYTGELGYEIFYPTEKIQRLWHHLLEHGALPAGLGVRDVLRLEMGYSLYGHELREDISPLEAGLSRFIAWNKDFIGRAALEKQKQSAGLRRSVAFVSHSRRIPRDGQTLFAADGRVLGLVTSGTFSFGLNRGIGLGLIADDSAVMNGPIYFGRETQRLPADITRLPFYKDGSLKK